MYTASITLHVQMLNYIIVIIADGAVVIISVFVVVLLYYKGIIQWRKKETKPQVVTPQTTVTVEAQLFDFRDSTTEITLGNSE